MAKISDHEFTTAEKELLCNVGFLGSRQLSESLKLIHDMALYHSEIPIGNAERQALFYVKILWEELERFEEETM